MLSCAVISVLCKLIHVGHFINFSCPSRTGHLSEFYQGAPWSWKVMEFRKTIFQAWKVMENDDNVMEFLLLH